MEVSHNPLNFASDWTSHSAIDVTHSLSLSLVCLTIAISGMHDQPTVSLCLPVSHRLSLAGTTLYEPPVHPHDMQQVKLTGLGYRIEG